MEDKLKESQVNYDKLATHSTEKINIAQQELETSLGIIFYSLNQVELNLIF
jgi:hypothetical protein